MKVKHNINMIFIRDLGGKRGGPCILNVSLHKRIRRKMKMKRERRRSSLQIVANTTQIRGYSICSTSTHYVPRKVTTSYQPDARYINMFQLVFLNYHTYIFTFGYIAGYIDAIACISLGLGDSGFRWAYYLSLFS